MHKYLMSVFVVSLLFSLAQPPSIKAQNEKQGNKPISIMNSQERIKFGERLIFGSAGSLKDGGVGKGMCSACHAFKKNEKRPVERAPNLFGIVQRASERIKESAYLYPQTVQIESFSGSGRARSVVEYLAESNVCPSCYVVEGYGVNMEGVLKSLKPSFHKPPISLSIEEFIAIDSWLFFNDGQKPPPPQVIRAAYEKFIPVEQAFEYIEESSSKPKKEMGQISEDVYLGIEGSVSGPPAPEIMSEDYPTDTLSFFSVDSRKLIWFFAQQHMYFGGLVSGILFLVFGFELRGHLVRDPDIRRQYELFSQMMLRFVVVGVVVSAALGGIFIWALISLYPSINAYLGSLFQASIWVFINLIWIFLLFVFIYYYSWGRMSSQGFKWAHLGIGLLANGLAMAIMMIANSWGSFMMSPSGVDEAGHYLGSYWNIIKNPFWNPLNFIRFSGNILLAAGVMAAYAGYKGLVAKTREEREYHDGWGYIFFLTIIAGFFIVPLIGHWFVNEIIRYNRQLAINLFLGELSWVMLSLVSMVAAILLCAVYYLWQRINVLNIESANKKYGKVVFFIIAVCSLVYITPSNLDLTMEEFRALDGRVHPLVYGYGVESVKQAALHIMLLAVGWSILFLWRSAYRGIGPNGLRWKDGSLWGVFLGSVGLLILLGALGFGTSGQQRALLTIPMTLIAVITMIIGIRWTQKNISRMKPVAFHLWEKRSLRRPLALIFLGVTLSWIMGLGGFMRSSLRGEWHIHEILLDRSSWVFIPGRFEASSLITLNIIIFWIGIILIFWLSNQKFLNPKKNEQP